MGTPVSHNLIFRQMLVDLGNLIKPDELDKLKFVCKNDIPTRVREQIDSAVKLFEALEERGKISESDQTYLKSVLNAAFSGRTDILRIVQQFEQGGAGAISPDSEQKQIGFRNETQYLEDNLGKEYKPFLRLLGVDDHNIDRIEQENPRNIKEVIHQCLCVWLRANRQLDNSELLSSVIDSLRRVKRNDLARKLETGNF